MFETQAFGPGWIRWTQGQSLQLESSLPQETPKVFFSLPRGVSSRPIHIGQGASQAIVPGTAAHPPPHNVLPAPLGRCPETGAPLSTPAASCWLQGQRDQERPPRHCWQLSPSSSLGEVALEQAGSVLTGCCGHSCSVTPGGMGQWETRASPFAFLQWFGGESGGAGGLPCGKVSGCQIQRWAARSASQPQYLCSR